MPSEKNLRSIFSDIATQIREKLKTTDVIKPYNMADKIKEISSGVDFKTAAYLLGHDVEMTMNTYTHVNNDMINNARNIIKKNLTKYKRTQFDSIC